MTSEDFQKIANSIPSGPGIYKYFDRGRQLIYVGKAKNLRKRVGSYFIRTVSSYKTAELVKRIHHIEFTLVDSEQDAFFLENALIKQHQPKYNINLKDDKSFPFIVIKNEDFPRVFLTRRKINDGSEYLGPFTSVGKVRELLNFIRSNIPLRTCKLNLTENNIRKGKFRVCLEYHLGNCKGPCEGFQTAEDYGEGLQQVKNILKGNLTPVISHFRKEMKKYAGEMAFEKAEITRKKIEHLQAYQARSVIVSRHIDRADVFSLIREGNKAWVNYLAVQNGTIVQTHSSSLEIPLDETNEDVLVYAVGSLRQTFNSQAAEIIVPFPVHFPEPDVVITVPKGGDRKKLLDLSLKNVHYFEEEHRRKKTLHLADGKEKEKPEKVLEKLRSDLLLPEIPLHIECFDNSNFQGSYPVSAMVCFKNGIPSKKDYRHFNIKSVSGINDFASMKEVVSRRYRRLLEEKESLPQLVIIDGGKGQLHAALDAISELGLTGKMTVIGLAKNEEEIFFPGDREALKLPYQSESLRLIRYIRDEVHRFGISFHRLKRSKGTFRNELEEIPGIGKNTADQLLKKYKSIKRIRNLSMEELKEEVGLSKAGKIFAFFSSEKNPEGV